MQKIVYWRPVTGLHRDQEGLQPSSSALINCRWFLWKSKKDLNENCNANKRVFLSRRAFVTNNRQ